MSEKNPSNSAIRILLTGDVMLGRGVDQILPHPCDPTIHESYLKSALDYVTLAEKAHGKIKKPVTFAYPWGDSLIVLQDFSPDLKIINLETSLTTSKDYWPGKAVNYRMNPKNLPCLSEIKVDAAVLANNHVLDWGYEGLQETLKRLKAAGIQNVGAGKDLAEASRPVIFQIPKKGRVVVFAYGSPTSGVPKAWAASQDKAGVNYLEDFSKETLNKVIKEINKYQQNRQAVIVSIHWGGNWGYEIEAEQQKFAHELIDRAGVDVVHGHSSHHAKGVESYQGKLIFYGCGDLINDYEGIEGYEAFRDDLALMYFISWDAGAGRLVGLEIVPFKIKQFQLRSPSKQDVLWLREKFNREGKILNTEFELNSKFPRPTLSLCLSAGS